MIPSVTPACAQARCSVSFGSGFARRASQPKIIAKIGFSSPSKLIKQKMPKISEAVAKAYFCPRIAEFLISISLIILFLQREFRFILTIFFDKINSAITNQRHILHPYQNPVPEAVGSCLYKSPIRTNVFRLLAEAVCAASVSISNHKSASCPRPLGFQKIIYILLCPNSVRNFQNREMNLFAAENSLSSAVIQPVFAISAFSHLSVHITLFNEFPVNFACNCLRTKKAGSSPFLSESANVRLIHRMKARPNISKLQFRGLL